MMNRDSERMREAMRQCERDERTIQILKEMVFIVLLGMALVGLVIAVFLR